MGTNFYHYTDKTPCPTCGRCEGGEKHIGKSSAGWAFALHVYPEDGINGLEDWIARWATGTIKDEYGDTMTPDEMRERITNRPHAGCRSPIDRYCIGHGEGPWDLIVGDFS